MADITPEKRMAQEEAELRSDFERQRLDYYLGLRYNFKCCDVDYWINALYEQRKIVYKPQKDPSWNQVRKDAGIGFFENAIAFFSEEKKRALEVKKAKSRKKLQDEVDKLNAKELNRCTAYNSRLLELLRAKHKRFSEHNPEDVEEYFSFALNLDSYSLDGTEHYLDYNLIYDADIKQLIIDYNLPEMSQIPRTKEWKVDRSNNIVSKEMNKSEYLEMYERVLFDIAMRTVGILFESDNLNVLNSIVFNGSCIYSEWQSMPTMIFSFIIPKSSYSYPRVNSMDFVSKKAIAELNEVRYLGDIRSSKAPSDLWETPPSKLVVPIKSSLS